MSGLATTVKTEAQAVERGFHTLAARIELIAQHLADAAAHPFTPAPLREALPCLMTVLEDIRQELAEQRKPCPCEGGQQIAQTVAAIAAAPADQANAALNPQAAGDNAQQPGA